MFSWPWSSQAPSSTKFGDSTSARWAQQVSFSGKLVQITWVCLKWFFYSFSKWINRHLDDLAFFFRWLVSKSKIWFTFKSCIVMLILFVRLEGLVSFRWSEYQMVRFLLLCFLVSAISIEMLLYLGGGSFLRTMGSIRSISKKASSVVFLGAHVDVPQSKLDVCLSGP